MLEREPERGNLHMEHNRSSFYYEITNVVTKQIIPQQAKCAFNIAHSSARDPLIRFVFKLEKHLGEGVSRRYPARSRFFLARLDANTAQRAFDGSRVGGGKILYTNGG